MITKQECPVCHGNGFVGIVERATPRRARQKARRTTTPTPQPSATERPDRAWGVLNSEHVDWTPHLVDTVLRVFRSACDPKNPLGPIGREEREYMVRRLRQHAVDAELQGAPQAIWSKLNALASEMHAGGTP